MYILDSISYELSLLLFLIFKANKESFFFNLGICFILKIDKILKFINKCKWLHI